MKTKFNIIDWYSNNFLHMNNKYMIGSHLSITYLPVRKWWMNIIKWCAKCQSVDIVEQYEKYSCSVFDIRVRYDKNGDLIMAHGPVEFEGSVIDIIGTINSFLTHSYVRIMLESNKEMKDQNLQEEHFKYFCEDIQSRFKNITFFGGNRKYDGKLIYNFNTTPPSLDGKYSSDDSTKLNDLWPWLYAKLHNKESRKSGTSKDCLFLDFVNI